MPHRAEHLPAIRLHHIRRVLFQRLAERVVGREEVPRLAALLRHGQSGAVGERDGIVSVMNRVGRALLVGQRIDARTHVDVRNLLFSGDLVGRESGG